MKSKSLMVSVVVFPVVALALASGTACVSKTQDEDSLLVSRHALTGATTVTLQEGVNGYAGTSDTTIYESHPTTNYGTSSILTCDGDDGTGRDISFLIRWDLASIPSSATVTAVSLTFQVTDASTTAYPVYALNRAFDESTATWNRASGVSLWATAGAKAASDRTVSSVGNLSAPSTGVRAVSLNAAGLAAVNGWVANPSTNYGFVVASTSNYNSIVVASSEHATVGYRPRISVTYTINAGTGGTGGTTSTGGMGGTGGTTGIVVDAAASSLDGARPDSARIPDASTPDAYNGAKLGFFVFSDSHVGSATNVPFSTALAQMAAVATAAGVPTIAALSLGDHTLYGSGAEWDFHMALATPYLDPAATAFGSLRPRYLAAMGNHDIMNSAWYTLWNDKFPGQRDLGVNSATKGVYFSTTYQNVLFVVRDTNTATNVTPAGAQVTDLKAVLSQSSATFKFVFQHKPAYYCGNGGEGPNKPSLALLDAAANANADVVFTGHSHVYTRTCRMWASHVCTNNGSGTVQVEVGSVGTTSPRAIKSTVQTLAAFDASGVPRSYAYQCSPTTGYDKLLGSALTFQYVKIEGCQATFTAYKVGVAAPFDTWTINHCP